MITKEEMDAMVEEEIKCLGVGSLEFKRKCQELDGMIEKARSDSTIDKPDNNLTSEEQDEKILFNLTEEIVG